MKYYLCNEKGVGGCEHDCASVKMVKGHQVCSAVQWELDYCGHIFCACHCGTIDIDEEQITIFDENEEKKDD